MSNEIIKEVASYYTEKIKMFGPTPKGVDWNSAESQELRFSKLLDIIKDGAPNFSLTDFGCGFGAMLPFAQKMYGSKFTYQGYDISPEMLEKALELFGDQPTSKWIGERSQLTRSDYVIASGIFNVRLKTNNEIWERYIAEVLNEFNSLSEQGFSFNMLTSYSDKEYRSDYLYYANPSFYFDYCKTNFSKYVSLIHDYPLYEFTILVRK